MDPAVLYWIWATLLVLACIAAWLTNLFMLPGNWIVVGLVALFVFLVPPTDGRGIAWWMVLVAAAIAGVGELIEFIAGAAGAAKVGGSRRAMLLAILGAILGSVAGAIVGIPIPFIGPLIAALGGASLGAFAGAYLGETWKGRLHGDRMEISRAALIGRLFGTLSKLMAGGVLIALIALDAYLPLY